MAYANVFRPNGFRPAGMNGRTDSVTRPRPALANRVKTATAVTADIAVGDAITLDANGNAMHAGTGDVVYGICNGFQFAGNPAVMTAGGAGTAGASLGAGPVSSDYLPAAVAGTVMTIEDRSAMFEVQTDTFAANNGTGLFNLSENLVGTDPVLRQSRQSINVGAGAGQQFRAVDIVNRPTDNAYGANARILVQLAQSVTG